jgi:hypothetical protein
VSMGTHTHTQGPGTHHFITHTHTFANIQTHRGSRVEQPWQG